MSATERWEAAQRLGYTRAQFEQRELDRQEMERAVRPAIVEGWFWGMAAAAAVLLVLRKVVK